MNTPLHETDVFLWTIGQRTIGQWTIGQWTIGRTPAPVVRNMTGRAPDAGADGRQHVFIRSAFCHDHIRAHRSGQTCRDRGAGTGRSVASRTLTLPPTCAT